MLLAVYLLPTMFYQMFFSQTQEVYKFQQSFINSSTNDNNNGLHDYNRPDLQISNDSVQLTKSNKREMARLLALHILLFFLAKNEF